MPDILIQCPECSREYKVSEYATVDNMMCMTCGAQLSRPSRLPGLAGAALRVKRAGRGGGLGAVAPALPDVPDALAIAGGPVVCPAPVVQVHRGEKVREQPRWLSLTVALLVLGALVAFQYFADRLDDYVTYYVWVRSGLALVAYGLVVMLAFQDHLGYGALCLVIPPYSLFYTAASVESGVLRGVFYAMVVAALTEVYFLPDHSALLAAGQVVNELIRDIDGLILKASESPI